MLRSFIRSVLLEILGGLGVAFMLSVVTVFLPAWALTGSFRGGVRAYLECMRPAVALMAVVGAASAVIAWLGLGLVL